MASRVEWQDDDAPTPRTPGSSISTPIGAGSDDEEDCRWAPSLNVTVTLRMMSGNVMHTSDYAIKDNLSLGHFIGIAKRNLSVKETQIALVIGDVEESRSGEASPKEKKVQEPFTAMWNNNCIWSFKVVRDFIVAKGYLDITVIQQPDCEDSDVAR